MGKPTKFSILWRISTGRVAHEAALSMEDGNSTCRGSVVVSMAMWYTV